ncbi:MAG: hypothetical protein CL927_18830 [Deltaproteobacteria bacterium]|nr:hypothetical protein [Deltaproteobacteria bacterium]HCH64015.1 hypothetical protein [Deltaproteobacteria bacterium]
MEAWNLIDMALPLRSWTRNVPFPEGVDLLCLAEGGMTTAQWREKADEVLTHSDPAYRQTLLRLIVRMFLDLDPDGETILETPFLRLLRDGDEKRRRDIFFVRYALAHPWCLLAARRLILPRIGREGDAAEISLAEWDAFVSTYIEASASEASRRKTRSTVIGVFHQLGVLQRSGRSTAPTTLKRAAPDPLAFGWVVADQLAAQLVGEATREWCVAESDGAQLFAVGAEQGQALLRTAVHQGELRAVKVEGERGVRAPAPYAHAVPARA